LAFIQEISEVKENAFPLEPWNERTVIGGTYIDRDWGYPIRASLNEMGERTEVEEGCGFFDHNCRSVWHFILIGAASISLMFIVVSCLVCCSRERKAKPRQVPQYAIRAPPISQTPDQFQLPQQSRWDYRRGQTIKPRAGRIGEIQCDETGYCWVVGKENPGNKSVREADVELRAFLPRSNGTP